MTIRVRSIKNGKVISDMVIPWIKTTKDIKRLRGPGITGKVLYDITKKGHARIEHPDGSVIEFKLMVD